jgi:hypothetical protein
MPLTETGPSVSTVSLELDDEVEVSVALSVIVWTSGRSTVVEVDESVDESVVVSVDSDAGAQAAAINAAPARPPSKINDHL